MTDALKHHWPEYLMEAACLGLFMVSAFTFGTILEHPASLVHQAIPNPLLRRFLMGLAMGSTAIGIIYSPWGKQSGAHINPSTTLTFFRLGKVATWDAIFYVDRSIRRRRSWSTSGLGCPLRVGLSSLGSLRRDDAWQGWCRRCVRCRDRHHFHPNDSNLERLEQYALTQVYRFVRRRFGRNLYHFGGAHFRHEHEPGAVPLPPPSLPTTGRLYGFTSLRRLLACWRLPKSTCG